MSAQILSPRFSFVRFGTQDNLQTCSTATVQWCLPVYAEDDIAFQFIVRTDTKAEADALCDLNNDLVTVGLVDNCEDEGFSLNFKTANSLVPDRFRISEKEVLYNWPHGLPGFDGIYGIGDCFHVKIVIDHPTLGELTACSNCFERIPADCYTSVLEYGGDENMFGFNYCGSGGITEEECVESCPEPTIIPFTDVDTLSIPYTTGMKNMYGDVPTVEIWILEGGQYVQPIIRVGFDAFPPTTILADLGGTATGYIKIS